jgi:hypothetical protein
LCGPTEVAGVDEAVFREVVAVLAVAAATVAATPFPVATAAVSHAATAAMPLYPPSFAALWDGFRLVGRCPAT